MKTLHRVPFGFTSDGVAAITLPAGEITPLSMEESDGLYLHLIGDDTVDTQERNVLAVPYVAGNFPSPGLDGTDLTGATYLGRAATHHFWLLAS